MADLIITALNQVIDRELIQQAEVRDEIKQRGTYWAAREIWTLRRQVASLRKRLAEQEAGQPAE